MQRLIRRLLQILLLKALSLRSLLLLLLGRLVELRRVLVEIGHLERLGLLVVRLTDPRLHHRTVLRNVVVQQLDVRLRDPRGWVRFRRDL